MPSPDFAAYNLQPLSRATEQPQGHFFDALLAIGANGLRTVEDDIQFQLSSLEPTNACGRMPRIACLVCTQHTAHCTIFLVPLGAAVPEAYGRRAVEVRFLLGPPLWDVATLSLTLTLTLTL